jgi:glycosyltransferase involved in cell wall biosynthesis
MATEVLGATKPERPRVRARREVPPLQAPKVVVVMPAHNAARTVRQTFRDIPPGTVHESILVDDASRDDTVAVARSLGISVLAHPANRGYGGNQKTCYREALARSADIVILLHPDYQYDPRYIPALLLPIRLGLLDIMLGSRVRTRRECLDSGMPLYKYLGNRFLTLVENLVMGQNLSEYHTGFRAYRREVLETLPYERFSEGFVFDSQFLVSAVDAGFRIGEIPVPVRYMPEASSIAFWRSVEYGLGTLAALGHFVLKRLGLARHAMFAARGA